jgi:3-isopropylmalate dehydrogenase
VDYCHVDAASMFFVSQPDRFDVVVTDNLFSDFPTALLCGVLCAVGLPGRWNSNP